MDLLKLFLKRSTVYLLLMSIFSTLINTGLLIFISSMITGGGFPFKDYGWLVFGGLIILSFLVNRTFQLRLIRLTNGILYDFEADVLHKLKKASFQHFENLGKEKVYTAINDTRVLTNTPATIIDAINAFIKIACCLGYMCYISATAGAFVIGVIVVLLVNYLIQNKKVERALEEVREKQNDYYRYLYDLLEGFKEVRMSTRRSDKIFDDYIERNLFERRQLNVSSSVTYLTNELAGTHSWYLLIGVILFGLPGLFLLKPGETITFIVTVLYIMGPVSVMIALIPFYTRVKIALTRLKEFRAALEIQAEVAPVGAQPPVFDNFNELRFENVTFEYFDKPQQRTFCLGPLTLRIKRGELVFITGGNGSGKSTFIMLFTGLYKPVGGSIFFNGERITLDNYAHYSNQIAAVFTDNHLFSANYTDLNLSISDERLSAYLDTLNLKDALAIKDDQYSLDSRLSKGQQKRLALILALLEDRDILVLDEWAAQQDVKYRAFFYETILGDLQQKGKTIIAVTHDDKYYVYADRMIKFEEGKIVSDVHGLRSSVEATAASV